MDGDLHFVKIHAPLEVLRRYSEILKLRMPMKEVSGHGKGIFGNVDPQGLVNSSSVQLNLIDTYLLIPTRVALYYLLSIISTHSHCARLTIRVRGLRCHGHYHKPSRRLWRIRFENTTTCCVDCPSTVCGVSVLTGCYRGYLQEAISHAPSPLTLNFCGPLLVLLESHRGRVEASFFCSVLQ